ncbi:MAG: HlyD family efflux transporter periplasmic adaptor subunit [bacterium]
MNLKIFTRFLRRKFVAGIIIALVAIGSYFAWRLANSGQADLYTFAAAERSTLISSVSSSGQVVVLNQIDIKPKFSGTLTAFYAGKDQEVKEGQILAVLDSKNAQRTVDDAEIALADAKEKLEELRSLPDAQSAANSENSLAQAERDFKKAKESYENVETDSEKSLSAAYRDGYNAVAAAFIKISGYMEDLKEVLGTDQSAQQYISSYKMVLNDDDSPFVQKLLEDFYRADDPFNKNYAFFITVFQNDGRDTVYRLMGDTLKTTKAISAALDSARHMYDAVILNKSYKQFNIASQIDKMKPKIESDASAVSSVLNSLQQAKDSIDSAIKNNPDKIKDAEMSFKLAQAKLDDEKLAFDELMAGADPKDIKSQENIVGQKEDALSSAKEQLASCYIRAPFSGTIASVGSDKIKIGDNVSSSNVLATLITKQKIVEMSLNEIDAAKVKTGQKATLTFDAIPDVSLSGRVSEVDALGQASQGVVSYEIKIAFDIDMDQIKPGMSAAADIIVEAKTDVLILPNSAVKSQGNSYYVELVESGGGNSQQLLANVSGQLLAAPAKTQPVEIGMSNDFYTEIISGLNEGDIVVASKASQTKTTQTQTQTQSQGFQMFNVGGGGQMRNLRGN